jgi:hypothetical protein
MILKPGSTISATAIIIPPPANGSAATPPGARQHQPQRLLQPYQNFTQAERTDAAFFLRELEKQTVPHGVVVNMDNVLTYFPSTKVSRWPHRSGTMKKVKIKLP